jgi:hypothetical protein
MPALRLFAVEELRVRAGRMPALQAVRCRNFVLEKRSMGALASSRLNLFAQLLLVPGLTRGTFALHIGQSFTS